MNRFKTPVKSFHISKNGYITTTYTKRSKTPMQIKFIYNFLLKSIENEQNKAVKNGMRTNALVKLGSQG